MLFAASTVVGCMNVTGQPCPSGGSQCPTGYYCSQGSCEPVADDGAVANIYASLAEGVDPSNVREVVMESYLDDELSCRLGRDPSDPQRLANLRPAVSALITLGEATPVRIPAGPNLVLVRAVPRAGDEDVARACFTWGNAQAGQWRDFGVTLWRDGPCGDFIHDVGEQCDHGPEGSDRCSPECDTRPILIPTSGGCITEPTIACTWDDDRDDGRCIIAWVENGNVLNVAVRHPEGQDDAGRAFAETYGVTHHPTLVSHDAAAGLVWVADGQLRGHHLNWVGDSTANFEIVGDASGSVATVARYVERGEGSTLLAGWISSGGGTIWEENSGESWNFGLPGATADAVAALFSSSLVVTWSVGSFGEDSLGAVIATRVDFEQHQTSEPVLVPDFPQMVQELPSVTPIDNERAFFVWADHNTSLDDVHESGIRGRRLSYDSAGESVRVNNTEEGSQHTPVVVTGRGYLAVAWRDEGTDQIRSRYLDHSGRPMAQSFGNGGRGDFQIATGGGFVGRPAIATLNSVYHLWVTNSTGCTNGGSELRMRIMPPPLP